MMKMTTKHPWQTVPAELICHAMEHLERDTEFDHRIAFLLLDLGVETLLRTFLGLPEAVTDVKSERSDRERAAKGNFPNLLKGVKAADPERITDGAIHHISRYHSHRNKLYHSGQDINVRAETTQHYARLAVALLNDLLRVDLTAQLAQLELGQALMEQIEKLEESLVRYREDVEVVVEQMDRRLVHPSFARDLAAIADLLGKEPEDFAEMFADAVGGHGIECRHMERAIDHFDDWQESGEPSDYLPPDLSDPTTIYLNYMESVLSENDPDLWETEEYVLDWYWVARDFVAETRAAGESATVEQIGTCERLRANLEATRERLPKWLSKAGVVKEGEGDCENDAGSRADG
jgi:hypothetical protein